MTENLAGLAGLVAQHDPQLYSPQGPVSGVNGTYTIAFLGCSCGWNSSGEASKAEKWSEHIVRVLATAAPAGTAPPASLIEASKNLLEACYQADAREELAEEIDGSLLDAVRDALLEVEKLRQALTPSRQGAGPQ